ncbi:hypothetical protein [Azospirillum brasilense]|uniref:[protein-PII] uridylyltransferase family protein n=1 Tax=Azospirillum brasilense TaxID=192 RepID=UPI0007057A6F|nr:hypothetical protein AMK58_00005 [Azospirillum brasilense]
MLEPNLKDGKGGLRDLQTLFWIAKYLYRVEDVDDLVGKKVLLPEEAQRFAKAARPRPCPTWNAASACRVWRH